MAKSKKNDFNLGTGRRKTAVVRVRIKPGSGKITVNGRDVEAHFTRATSIMIIKQPLVVTNMLTSIDIDATAHGGGPSGQAGAMRHGLARALVRYDESLKSALRQAGYLTRDSREVERKKVGLHGARRGTQFSKR